MEQLTRSATPQYARLDRAFQNATRPPDFDNQLAVIRVISDVNLDANRTKVSIGPKLGDSCFTMRVEYPIHPRGARQIKLVLTGSLAEKAVSEGWEVGQSIRFDALVDGKLDEFGRLTRMPVAYASWAGLEHPKDQPIEGTTQI